MLAWSLAGTAGAQQASTPAVVPPPSTLAPPIVAPAQQVPALPARPEPAPELGKPEDDIRLDVRRYVLDEGAPPELVAALAALTERFTGPDRGFEDLVGAAAELTRFMQRELGYYLAYAYVPEQVPQDGVVRLAVLEGRLDRVVLQWDDSLPVRREVVEAYLDRLVPGSILRVRDVERVVFLVNDLRGITTRFEVKAGSTPGTAQLIVTPRADSVWSGKADVDMNGARSMGQYRIGGLVQRNSPFGRGDGFTANLLSSTTRGLKFALLGYNTPVGGDGFKLGASVSAVRYRLDETAFPLELNGDAQTTNAFALYPAVRSRNLNLFALASFDAKDYDDRNLVNESRKRVNVFSLGTTGDFRDNLLGGGVSTFDATLSSGRVRYVTVKPQGLDVPDQFRKLGFNYTRLQDVLTGRVLAYLALRGQWTGDNLDTTEQFRTGGPDGVRAFAPGEGTGDRGVIASLELRLLPPEDWLGSLAREMVANVFYDSGRVQYRARPDPNTRTANSETFSAAGLGLAWVRPSQFSLRFSLARPLAGEPKSDPDHKGWRLYLQATKFFE